MKHLSHNGILVPKYEPKGFHIMFKGKSIDLTPEQEEMAVAWVRKLGTEYVEDKVFIKNFFGEYLHAFFRYYNPTESLSGAVPTGIAMLSWFSRVSPRGHRSSHDKIRSLKCRST